VARPQQMHGQASGNPAISDVQLDACMSHTIGGLDEPTREALQVLGQVLRQLRAERGLSQRGLGARCGLSQSTISRLECGLAEGVRVAWLARLLAGLDSRVRVLPDTRPMLERCHGFTELRRAFSPAAGGARWRDREKRRRDRLEAYANSLDHDGPGVPGRPSDYPTGITDEK
jgi:transcriptional regulator with XRE-family HTH domain